MDLVLGAVGAPGIAPMMDRNMMLLNTGRKRTLAEYSDPLCRTGFMTPTIKTTNPLMAVLAAAAA